MRLSIAMVGSSRKRWTVAHVRLQGRRARPADLPQRRRPHRPLPRARGSDREAPRRRPRARGEVAVFDPKFVSRFELLRDPNPAVLCTPPMFIAFDVLQVGRHDVRPRPLESRRSILAEAIGGADSSCPCDGSTPMARGPGGRWRVVASRGFVAKDPTAPYVSGRTRRWLKVKQRDYRVEERGFHR